MISDREMQLWKAVTIVLIVSSHESDVDLLEGGMVRE